MFKLLVRNYSNKPSLSTYFHYFPKTFPQFGPPKDEFKINPRKLRKEFLKIQSTIHPDLNQDELNSSIESDEESKDLNQAYQVLKNPLTRSQYYLKLNGIDLINDDSKTKNLDQDLLLEILDIHEQLETCSGRDDLKKLKEENDDRIKISEDKLNELFKNEDFENASLETVKLKYWNNIKTAIRDWEPGKKVNLTH